MKINLGYQSFMLDDLKTEVEKRFGKRVTYQKDCKTLSSSILNEIGFYISPATLRRFFGLLLTNSNPSSVTLDILSKYAGYSDWNAFKEKFSESTPIKTFNKDIWEKLAEKSKKISLNTVESIRKRSSVEFNNTISRVILEEKLEEFVKSRYKATAIIGPGGYGKSTLLANWCYKKLNKKTNDIELFLTTHTLESISHYDYSFVKFLDKLVGTPPNINFFSRLIKQPSISIGNIIIIIDNPNELALQNSKLEVISSAISDFVQLLPDNSNFKIIISFRPTEWEKFKIQQKSLDKWFNVDNRSFNNERANLPPLTNQEIQQILDKTINTKFSTYTLADFFDNDLIKTISYPYFLELFIEIYNPGEDFSKIDNIQVIREFLKKQVYFTKYSEEKVDILNKIVELTNYGKESFVIPKNSLKDYYPIHLKKGSDYFNAYEDLLSFGIINEEQTESLNFGYHKTVKIQNNIIFQLLIIQKLIQIEGSISISLFKKLESEYSHHELLVPLMTITYQLAYQDNAMEALKKFFELNPSTIKKVLNELSIPLTFRNKDYLRNGLITHYSKNSLAKEFLFLKHPDIDYLAKGYGKSLLIFKNTHLTEEENMYLNILLTYRGLLKLDLAETEKYYQVIQNYQPINKYNILLNGWWFACINIYRSTVKGEISKDCIDQALEFITTSKVYTQSDLDAFMSVFIPSIVLSKQNFSQTQFKKVESIVSKSFRHDLNIYLLLLRLLNGETIPIEEITKTDEYIQELEPLNSAHAKILSLVFKANYYFKLGTIDKAYYNFRNAIELSNYYDYKLFEVKLLKILSFNLRKFGETEKALEFQEITETIVAKSGFNLNFL